MKFSVFSRQGLEAVSHQAYSHTVLQLGTYLDGEGVSFTVSWHVEARDW